MVHNSEANSSAIYRETDELRLKLKMIHYMVLQLAENM